MKNCSLILLALFFIFSDTYAQDSVNCFLNDFTPRTATVPSSQNADKPSADPTVYVTIEGADTLGRISNYMFGNAFPAWLGNVTTDANLLKYLKELNLSFIRYPGGSWSDIFFWDGNAKYIPPQVWDGNNNKWSAFTAELGKNTWVTTVDNYYAMRKNLGTQGLITINYSYARYGTSGDPVAYAAHYAADWVRYDKGRTLFWEIGNENAGPWEAGWKIDTALNKDNQPPIISGTLYGDQFNVFADSMRAAAAEIGTKIYIGCQVLHFDATYDANTVNRKWNEEVFKEVGASPDFYIMHNYFGANSTSLKGQVDYARSAIINNINFIRSDIAAKHAAPRPVAITEWNCGGPDNAKVSIANGVQAVVLFCEMIKNNFGMSCRWPIANWETDGLLYRGNNTGIPAWSPRPDFYYIYYLEKFTGDHTLQTSVSGSGDILAYATSFSSGHEGIVIVNKGGTDQVVQLRPEVYGFGDKYYIYTLTGGDNTSFSQTVLVNGEGPVSPQWGPIADLPNIKANAYNTGNDIKFDSPAKSVEYIMLEPGTNVLSAKENNSARVTRFALNQNYPNPFNPITVITYELPKTSLVTIKVYNLLGEEVASLLNKVEKPAGRHQVSFNASNLPSGVYFYRMQADKYVNTKKLIFLK